MNATSRCPQCDAEVGGEGFCPRCGAALRPRECPACGETAAPGSRFCTRCGSSLVAPGRDGDGDGSLGWWVAGLVLVVLILFLVVPVLSPDRGLQEGGPSPTGGAPSAASGAAPDVDLSSMTPRQAADRLFNRVMRAGEAGDTGQVTDFLPMAVAAYERARPLNADGLYHLSMLLQTGSRYEEALATATSGLEEWPNHLLLLGAAGQAARELGDSAVARSHFSHLLDVWEEERASTREEYELHTLILPTLRSEAEAFLGGAGGAGGPEGSGSP